MIDKVIDKAAEKVPNFDQYKSNTKHAVSYIFMIAFFVYFLYKEFWNRDDCGQRIETMEYVIKQKDVMIDQLNARVTDLERAVDIKNGIINEVKTTVSTSEGGAK